MYKRQLGMSSGGAATGRGGVIHGHERFFKRLGLGTCPHPPFLQQFCWCALMKRRSVDVLLCVLRAAAFLSSARERTQEAHQNTLLEITIDDACTAVDLSIFVCKGLGCHLCLPCALGWSQITRSNQRRREEHKYFSVYDNPPLSL